MGSGRYYFCGIFGCLWLDREDITLRKDREQKQNILKCGSIIVCPYLFSVQAIRP